MRRKSIYFLVIVMVVFLFVIVSATQGSDYLHAEDSGFTKLPISARALGMGGAFVAVANDYSACYYNPAGLVHLPSRQVGSMYTNLYGLGLLSHSFLSFAEPNTGMGSGALSWSHLSANLEPEEWTYDCWTYSYADYLFNSENFPLNSWGANIKYIQQNILDISASGYSFDLSYLGKNESLSWGICVQDFFSQINWGTGHVDILPMNIMAGVAFTINQRGLIALDVELSPEDIPRNLKLGGEWKMGENIFLRGGLVRKFQKEENLNFSGGIGFKINLNATNGLLFNYAFTSSTEFPGTHYLSLSIGF